MLKRFSTLQPLQLPLCLSDPDTLDLPVTADRTTPRLGLGLWLWATMTVVISIIAVIQPHRCISWIYRQAAEAWATASPLYAPGLHGYLYFPTGTLVYGPFALLPQPLDSHAWRLFLSASLVLAVRRYAYTLVPGAGAAVAGMILALTIPAAVIDLLRGQMTLLMAAILLVAAADAADGRHRRAGFWLALAVFVKPLALVPAMLIIVALPAAGLSFAAGLLIGVATSMLHPHPD
ncbi:glycosyltransferase 87 family protein [Azospirillum melinis]